jgi:hypothetical protein
MSGYESDDSISEPASTHNTTNSSMASPISTNTPNHHHNQHNNTNTNHNNNNNNNTNHSSNNHLGVSSGLLTPSSVTSSQTSLSQFSHGLTSPPTSTHMQHHNRFDYGRPMTDTTNSLGGLGALNQVHSTSSASSFDFKPQHLTDWYSHAHMSMMGVPRYETMKPVSHHVTSALPTPPSSGHSPISHLSNHLHQLLPSTTSAYT